MTVFNHMTDNLKDFASATDPHTWLVETFPKIIQRIGFDLSTFNHVSSGGGPPLGWTRAIFNNPGTDPYAQAEVHFDYDQNNFIITSTDDYQKLFGQLSFMTDQITSTFSLSGWLGKRHKCFEFDLYDSTHPPKDQDHGLYYWQNSSKKSADLASIRRNMKLPFSFQLINTLSSEPADVSVNTFTRPAPAAAAAGAPILRYPHLPAPNDWDNVADSSSRKILWRNYANTIAIYGRYLPDPTRMNFFDRLKPDAWPAGQLPDWRAYLAHMWNIVQNDDCYNRGLNNERISSEAYDVIHLLIRAHHGGLRNPNHVFSYIIDKSHKAIIRLDTNPQYRYLRPGPTKNDMRQELLYMLSYANDRSFDEDFGEYDLINPDIHDWQIGPVLQGDTCVPFQLYLNLLYMLNLSNIQRSQNLHNFETILGELKLDNVQISNFFINLISKSSQIADALRNGGNI